MLRCRRMRLIVCGKRPVAMRWRQSLLMLWRLRIRGLRLWGRGRSFCPCGWVGVCGGAFLRPCVRAAVSAVLLIALTVAVSVLATLSASVLERRRDFALMKALGGSQAQLMGMFLLEALVLAVVGVAVGFVVGSAAAWAISEGNFHTAALPHLSVLPLVLLLNVAIAAMAALLPVRVLRGLQPAALLKGE